MVSLESSRYLHHLLHALERAHLDPALLAFWKLLTVGHYGAFSLQWVKIFQDFFALHLLVLSGSQAQGLKKFWELALCWLPTRWRRFLLSGFFFSNFLLWLGATLWPAPLVRAFFLQVLEVLFPRLAPCIRFVMAFVMHILCFPEHLHSRSFYLSWMCYGTLVLSTKLAPRHSQLLSHLLCWLLAWLLFAPHFRDVTHLCLLFFLNIFLLFVFDAWLVPITGLTLGLSFFAYLGWVGDRFFDALLPLFIKGGSQLFLVVVCNFRYILSYDL